MCDPWGIWARLWVFKCSLCGFVVDDWVEYGFWAFTVPGSGSPPWTLIASGSLEYVASYFHAAADAGVFDD